MRHTFIIIIAMLSGMLYATISKAQTPLAYWGLNEANGSTTTDSVSGTAFSIQTKWSVIERVTGVTGQALRTDGYTCWVQGRLSKMFPDTAISISAWVVPETYPVATAAIWSLWDTSLNKGVSVSMDKFGRLVVAASINNTVINAVSAHSFAHAAWNYVMVNIQATSGNMDAYINGILVIHQTFTAGAINWPAVNTNIYIGRSAKDEYVSGIFRDNLLNGILDEIRIDSVIKGAANVLDYYNNHKPSASPDITTPSSRFASDFYRPKYHGLPQAGWTNEPHGLLYRNGRYHLFFQKNGNGPYFSQQNWGHITSTDLLHWTEQTVALWPQPQWESVGIWSGHCIINAAGNPTIYYTGVDGTKAGIGSATSVDDCLTWMRSAANPLIPRSPAQYPNKDFRDPYAFYENGTWYMIIGSGLQSPAVGTVFLYQSTDGQQWNLIGPMYSGDPFTYDSGIFWEMPVFWKFGQKYVLLVNKVPAAGKPALAFYWVGTFANNTFVPDNPVAKNLDLINHVLSPSVNTDSAGRVTAIGIIPDELPALQQYNHGWTHLYTLPRVWSLKGDTLVQAPHPALTALRGTASNYSNVALSPSGSGYLGSSGGWQLEIDATISPGTATQTGFIIGKNAGGTELTRIYYDYTAKQIVVDRTQSSLNSNITRDIKTGTYVLPAGVDVNWKIFIDGSAIDVFINDEAAFATRIFPVNSNSNLVDVFVKGGTATLKTGQVYALGKVITDVQSPSPDTSNKSTLLLYPNPVKDKLYLQFRSAAERKTVSVVDVCGKKIFEESLTTIQQGQILPIEVLHWARGVYFLTVTGAKGQELYKFIKG